MTGVQTCALPISYEFKPADFGIADAEEKLFFKNLLPNFVNLIGEEKEPHVYKFLMRVFYTNTDIRTGNTIREAFFHQTKDYEKIDPNDNIINKVKNMIEHLQNKISEFQERGSNWVIDETDYLHIHTDIYRPTRGTSYFKLQEFLENKHAIINARNKMKDALCGPL